MEIELCVLDLDYITTPKGAVIRIFGKDKNGRNVTALDRSFEPYFFVLTKPGKINVVKKRIETVVSAEEEFDIKDVKIVERVLHGERKKLIKVVCDYPPNVPKIRDTIKRWERGKDVIEEYEYGINFYRRYMIDKNISGLSWIKVSGNQRKDYPGKDIVIEAKKIKILSKKELPKINSLAFDIESVEDKGEIKIVMISLVSKGLKKVLTYGRGSYPKYVKVVKNEKELLKEFVDIVKKENPDLLVGYNSDMFDFKVIQERATKLKVRLDIARDLSSVRFSRRARVSSAKVNGRPHIDLFSFISKILSPELHTEVLTLNAVSSELLGDSKIDIQFEEIWETWKRKRTLGKLAEYCLKDSELTLRLSEFILPQIYEISKIVGQLPFDVSRMTYGQLVEWHLSKKAFIMHHIMPNQPRFDEIGERRKLSPFIGAYVKEPIPGLHDDVAVMDLKSMYPAIIVTFNISPETLNCKCCKKHKVPDTKYHFCKKKKGFVSTVIKELIERRDKIKRELKEAKKGTETFARLSNQSYAIKTIANATYGMFAYAGAKWYCRECAKSSAAYGRYFIKKVIAFAEKEGFIVIYSDTDSLFVKLKDKKNLKSEINKFLKKINKKLPGLLEVDIQGFYKRGIFIPRGIGPGTAKKRYALIDKKGNLTIRGLEKVRRDWCELAKDTQGRVLQYILRKKDVKGATSYIKSVIKRLKQRKVNLKDLTIYVQLTKPISEYKIKSPHVSAAKRIEKKGGTVVPGMTIMFVITKRKGSISEKAEPVEFANIKDIDEDYYISNQIIPVALRVLTVLGVTKNELLGQVGLKKWMKK